MGRKSREKREKRRARQFDEVFELAPGIVMARKGRGILVRNDQTPEQRAEFISTFLEKRPAAEKEIDSSVSRLRGLLSTGSPLKLLAVQAFRYLSGNPETQKEFESEGPSLFVEYPTWLYLTNAVAPVGFDSDEGGRYGEFSELVQTVVRDTQFLLGFEHFGEGRDTPTALDEAIFKTRLEHNFVRQPAYAHHQVELLRSLFDPFAGELVRVLGFTVEDVLQVHQNLSATLDRRLNTILTEARERRRRWLAAIHGEAIDLDEDDTRLVAAIREAGGGPKLVEQAASNMLFDNVHETYAVSRADVSSFTGVPTDRAERCLAAFSLRPGQKPIGDSRPSADSGRW